MDIYLRIESDNRPGMLAVGEMYLVVASQLINRLMMNFFQIY